ncbi:MAG: oxidoreductase, partial [Pseudarthrobacter sp.]|nr:oxidoreductase [Pseudarthrobacter sp.]
FVRMGEHFADSVLNGTPLRYDLADAAGNARVLEALDQAARKDEASVPEPLSVTGPGVG